ncbi:hypothetical protein IHN32_07695 [Deinococcus sp. 14RED07]|uniref:hypothetical protein n=1 Tax=Deinococcus sp. 14RED07 TaxID=2745874 RepID=UPI001E443E1C|nr:hypothetical protein [Deinococcus sp. 14RED07]MCD0175824.1 hypothetical protein [Deinococcus sp. 14RED07]
MLHRMNRHDLANLEQLALLREALEAEPAQAEEVSELVQSVAEPVGPGSPAADPEPLA